MTKTTNQKGISQALAIIILVVIVILLAGLGYYYLRQIGKETNVNIALVKTNKNLNINNINQAIDISNWETYTDAKTGVFFKYPNNTTIDNSVTTTFQFIKDKSTYIVQVINKEKDREQFWINQEETSGISYNFEITQEDNNIIFRSKNRAITVILTDLYEISISKYGPDGNYVAPSEIKDDVFLGMESAIGLNGVRLF